MTVRTRFAPSPTGDLHVGGARTALFCYLFARRQGGEFILRIEDTDRERSTQSSIDSILEAMDWLALEYDGDAIYQTDRMDRYRQVIDQLLEAGKAYRCYCTKQELDELREKQMAAGLKPRYDGRYRDFTGDPPPDIDPVIRFKNPLTGVVTFEDMVRGPISVANEELDDLVIARSDGTPTYNFTVVVDDMDMQISHVIRGDDHINNTPRQINIYHALDAAVPVFAHLPMILGDDGARLSKRHGAVSVLRYRADGFLPEALLNYLVRLGWSHGDQEIFSRQEMLDLFDLGSVNRAPSSFSTDKLLWLNQHYLSETDIGEVVSALRPLLDELQIDTQDGPPVEDAVALLRERARTVVELAEQMRFLYEDFESFDPGAAKKQLRGVAEAPLKLTHAKLQALEAWSATEIDAALKAVAEELDVGMGKVGQPLRVAVTGRGAAPSNDLTLALLGKERTLDRIQQALDFIERRMQNSN